MRPGISLCLEGSQPAPLQCDRIGQALAATVLTLAMLLVATMALCMYGIALECWSDLKGHTRLSMGVSCCG